MPDQHIGNAVEYIKYFELFVELLAIRIDIIYKASKFGLGSD